MSKEKEPKKNSGKPYLERREASAKKAFEIMKNEVEKAKNQ